MRYFLYPLRYLAFRDASEQLLVRRDWLLLLIITALICGTFFSFPSANFFGEGGFLDGVGGVASTLTGFYIAALVATAAFASPMNSMDEVIVQGAVLEFDPIENSMSKLTRRQFVCAIFGYLAFISFALSIISLIGVALAAPLSSAISGTPLEYIALVVIMLVAILVAHMMVTTSHGLYYLVDRLYAVNQEILPIPDNKPPSESSGQH